jgi:exo-beta-1,3-glucanase (GH17 family)
LATLFALLLAACGGGGTIPIPGVELRPLSPEFATRKAVAYSPFRTNNRDTELVTAAHIKEDLDLLVHGNFKLIRMFDSSSVTQLTLQVIKENGLDIKVMLGIYINSESSPYLTAAQKAANQALNQAEMDRGVALANAYPDLVLSVSIGNETMVSWSFVPTDVTTMAAHIKSVRDQVAQPVTTDDNWAFFAQASSIENNPKAVVEQIDFVSMHSYALLDSVTQPDKWDWQQVAVAADQRAAAMMNASLVATQDDHTAVRAHLDSMGHSAMPVLIGETGWKAVPSGSPAETFRAHPVNQKMYVDRLNDWLAASKAGTIAGPLTIVYFEAFDEPWKGSDDKWGLFNVSRKARFVVQDLYPAAIWEPGAWTLADALYYVPLIGGGTVTANRYTLYAEAVTAGEAKPGETWVWSAWDNGKTSVGAFVTTTPASPDPVQSFEITPTPAVWGWGMTINLPTTAEDLRNFEAAGKLNFSIKTNYGAGQVTAGTIEVGFLTGTGSSAYDVYMAIKPGEYGYLNDGNWHNVSVPISEIKKHGAKAFGNESSATSVFDLTKVTNPFVIADRYANTGKAQGTGDKTTLTIDAIYWSK